MPKGPTRLILVAGATGYVGARLVPRLIAAGHRVRAMGRSLEKLRSRPWAGLPGVELVVADVSQPTTLGPALAGVDVVYYLVHAMTREKKEFAEADRAAAQIVAAASASAGVSRIIYLSGLGSDDPKLSAHLRSRAEVGKILQEGTVPVTIFRAAIILGSGSSSFEILRYLADRLPIMITPRWLSTPVQPIAIRDVLAYLIGALDAPETTGRTFDIGGPDVTTYRALLGLYAQEAGLRKRVIIGVPFLTPRLSTHWIRLVTPAPAALVRPLAEGLRHPMVCQEDSIHAILPRELLSSVEAIRLAIDAGRGEMLESHWSDAGRIPPSAWAMPGDDAWTTGKLLKYERSLVVDAARATVWKPIASVGGRSGWYYANGLWLTRGAIDALLGGVGHRRGRVRPHQLRAGDVVDFWRVAEVVAEEHVRFAAEMKLPGDAVLDIAVKDASPGGGTRVVQTAWFRPRGLGGLAYWYGLYPIHVIVFRGMLRGIAREVQRAGQRALA